MTSRKIGVILVLVSAFVFSTAGIFTKGVATSAWGIVFWRGLAAASFTIAYLALRGRVLVEIRCYGWPAFAATLVLAAGTASFIPAFKLSSVANVALIYGAAPFVAAALSWICLREAPTSRVVIASLVAFGGVIIIFAGSAGTPASQGDLLALVMTFMMAGSMVIYRAYPATTAALPAALSSIVLLPVAYAVGDPMKVPLSEMPVLILFGLVFAVASVTLSEGARRLPSGEVALLSILEMPLAAFLAFLLLSERVGLATFAGGSLILLAVGWSQTTRLRKR